MEDSLPPSLPSPPAWSLQVGELGRALVIISAALFLLSAIVWALAPKVDGFKKAGGWLFLLGCLGLLSTFGCLAALFIDNRFEYKYVWSHADLRNTIPYRIAGIWSGQEGSFLLWGCAAALFGIFASRVSGKYRRWFSISFSLFLGAIAGILAYESPFVLNMIDGQAIVPPDGAGLAPSLQNYWVTIHPPTIFLGFGSLTVLFAFALAALIERDFDTWIPMVRPWALVSMTLVGLGLCMGGFWAYETLGWGGFWMWDPVENVSFVPWCFTAAFVHGIIVQTAKKRWKISNLLMGGLPFLAFVYGTFLTRSGFLADQSVHSFAEMNRSALKLLIGIMGIAVVTFFGFWIARALQSRKEKEEGDDVKGLNREGFYRAGSILLTCLGLATMIGMSFPFFMAISGRPVKVVEEGVYHQALPWIFIPIMLAMATAPFVGWRGIPAKEFSSKVYTIICIAVGLTGFALLGMGLTPFGKVIDLAPEMKFPFGIHLKGLPWMIFLVWLCFFVLVGNIWRISELVKRSKLGVSSFLAHVGVAVLMAGLIISRGFERHDEGMVMADHPGRVLNYEIRYKGMTANTEDRSNKVLFDVMDTTQNGKVLYTADPGLYYVEMADGQKSAMVWPSIKRSAFYDVYFTLHPPQNEASSEIDMQVGKTVQIGRSMITYTGMDREGEPGMAGTKFVAKLKVVGQDGKSVVLTPKLELSPGSGPVQHPATLDKSSMIALTGMNAADKSVKIQVQSATPMYPIEIYHKPMTGLVWLGTGIMTLAGLMAAYYRRVPRRAAEPAVAETDTDKGRPVLVPTPVRRT